MAEERKKGADAEVIPLAEEEARIDKREVVTGRVRIATKVDEVTQAVRATLSGETVDIERVPVDREIGEVPAVRQEGDVTVVPVVEEVLVVEKRLVLKEEVRIRRRHTSEDVEVPVTLRRERVEVERAAPEEASPTGKPVRG